MNEIKNFLLGSSVKTTLLGYGVAIVLALEPYVSGNTYDWKVWVHVAFAAAFGRLVSDAKKIAETIKQ